MTPQALARGTAALTEMGFSVVLGRSVLARDGYLAGRDEARAEDLNSMLADPAVRGVWFARGGYGTARILDRLDWDAAARDPKVLVGYSDLTALFATATRRTRASCLYGPVVAELGDPASFHALSLRKMLAGEAIDLRIPRRAVLRHGRAKGPLVGGNLTVLAHLLGTPHAPAFRRAVLFLEETGESVYRLDRLLQHLRMSGALDGIAAAVFGSFEPGVRRRKFPPDRPVLELVREVFMPLGVPVAVGIPAGHLPGKWTLPIGGAALLDTSAGRLTLSAKAP
ncbi:MAG: LD-carboxypeptidase [Acidobacteriia bacterium]|nr:LD-carboxypeptidase [Terriglobia bacterium]